MRFSLFNKTFVQKNKWCYIIVHTILEANIMTNTTNAHVEITEAENLEKRIYAKERYEKEKRTSKPISFNRQSEAAILNIASQFKFGVWVKNILSHFNGVEVNFVKEDENFIPSSLVQHAIENGYFDLDEYLDSKGKKIVDKTQKQAPMATHHHIAVDEYNQEYYP